MISIAVDHHATYLFFDFITSGTSLFHLLFQSVNLVSINEWVFFLPYLSYFCFLSKSVVDGEESTICVALWSALTMVAEEFKSGTGSVCDELVSVVIDDGGDVDAEGAEGAMSVCPSRSTLSNDFLH
jgi:hypothetical protein